MLASLAPVWAQAELPAAPPAEAPRLTGLYGGSHVCETGEHGALLEITRVIASGEPDYPWRLEGRYAVFPVIGGRAGVYGNVAGSFALVGDIRADGQVRLDALGWLVMPSEGEGAGDLTGRFSARSDGLMQFEGRIETEVADECGAVLLTRALLPEVPTLGSGRSRSGVHGELQAADVDDADTATPRVHTTTR